MDTAKKSNKPMIKRNEATGKLEAGFLDGETGVFNPVSEIEKDEDMKKFMSAYGLSVVFNSLVL